VQGKNKTPNIPVLYTLLACVIIMENVKNLDWYLIDGKWHHFVWVYDGGKLKQFVDGVLVVEQDSNAR